MKPIIFVRFGSLKCVSSTQKLAEERFHSPPAKSGFYAMPKQFQEFFLIGSLKTTQPQVFKKGNKEEAENEYYDKLSLIRKEFTLKNDDLIWSHFVELVKPNEALDRNKYWVLTTVETYAKLLTKCSLTDRINSSKHVDTGNINSVKKGSGFFSKDHYEVFIIKDI
jgi:hypothetical protein